jgi:magnesium transporter
VATDPADDSLVRHYLDAAVPVVPLSLSAGEALAALRGREYDSAEAVFAVGDGRRFAGVVPLTALLAAPTERPIGDLVVAGWPTVSADLDREAAASLAILRGVPALPVVDEDGRFLGAVPAAALMAILRDEHLEDLHHMAGIWHASEAARGALEAPPLQRARYRLPWLFVGLAGSGLATLVVARFEGALEADIAVAFFIPAIVYLADAIGTQSEAVAVRGLSLTQAGLLRLLVGEFGTGVLMGFALAMAALPAVYLGFGDFALALSVALSIFAAGAVATTVGLLLPWAFARAGFDPAFGSGPVATVIQDVLSLLIYFIIATQLLR